MSTNDFDGPLARAHELALDYLHGMQSRPVVAPLGVPQLVEKLDRGLNDEPIDATIVLEELAEDVREGLSSSAGGSFFAWVIGGSVPASLAADWLTSVWDQNAAAAACSPAAAAVESVAGEWLKDLLGLPQESSFAFVTGCLQAHFTCLVSARNALLKSVGWDVEVQGLFGAPNIRIVTSASKHASFEKAVRLASFGLNSIVSLPVDDQDRLTPPALEAALAENSGTLTIVLLQAGDINIGAFDDFKTLIPIAKRYGAWVHVDGAFGLWAAASRAYRPLMEGCERADSWACDGHKWLNVPYDSGFAFVRDSSAHRAAMCQKASYVEADDAVRDQFDWTPEWSRRARGFATYAAIREMGRSGIEAMIDRCCQCSREICDGVADLLDIEVLWRPTLNQGLFRFRDSDDETLRLLQATRAEGRAFFSDTVWRGKRAIRVSVVNWQTGPRDVENAVEAIRSAIRLCS